MMGEVQKEDIITTGGAKPGDVILLSKGICVEGTSIIAREKERDLLSRGVSSDLLKRAKHFLYDPGISVLKEARLACKAGRVNAMHDVTEGGLANGLHEMSLAAGVEIEVELDRIPLYEESRILCEAMDLNPLGVIASGSLIITAPPMEAEKILMKTEESSATITSIGRVKAFAPPSVMMKKGGRVEPVPFFGRDELAKIF
jgi:hydrogenase maturation factor